MLDLNPQPYQQNTGMFSYCPVSVKSLVSIVIHADCMSSNVMKMKILPKQYSTKNLSSLHMSMPLEGFRGGGGGGEIRENKQKNMLQMPSEPFPQLSRLEKYKTYQEVGGRAS